MDVKRYIDLYLREQCMRIQEEYPEQNTFYLDYADVQRGLGREASEDILEDFDKFVNRIYPDFVEFFEGMLDTHRPEFNFRLANLPNKKLIRQLKNTDVNKFVSVEGIVQKISQIKQEYTCIAYECLRCGHNGS